MRMYAYALQQHLKLFYYRPFWIAYVILRSHGNVFFIDDAIF